MNKRKARDRWNGIPTYIVTCICNTDVEVVEHCIGECPNCHRGIDDKGVMQ